MSSLQEPQNHHPDIAPFRIDVPLHNLLQKPEPAHSLLPPRLTGERQKLPEPVFPQQPELLTEDWLADAGVAIVNFTVDAVDVKPGLPKALNAARKQFDYLIRKQYRDGYSVFFNMNICPQQPGRHPAIDRDCARGRHCDRLPHQRVAHARAAAV